LANIQRQLILSLAIFTIVLLLKIEKLRPMLFTALFSAICFFDLFSAHKEFLFPISPERVSQAQPILSPRATNLSRFFYYPRPRDLHPAFFAVQGRPRFHEGVALSFQNYLPNVGILNGIDYFQELDAIGRRPYTEFLNVVNNLDFDRQLKLLRTFNIKHIVSFRELPERGTRLLGRYPQYYSWLYEVRSPVPRAYMVNLPVIEMEPSRVLPLLASAEFDPEKQVVVGEQVAITPTANFSARVEIPRYENQAVDLTAAANGDGVLVLADSYYPGWKAYLDGRETPILRVNHFYRGVIVPAGQHRIEFRYEPRSFAIGLIISLSTIVGLGLLCGARLLRARTLARRNAPTVRQIFQPQ
jgi:hypothetical protein